MKNIYLLIGLIVGVLAFMTGDFVINPSLDWFGGLVAGGAMLGSVFGCFDQSPRSCNACPEDEANKIVHVAFVKKGTTITTSSPSAFISTLLAAELACNAYIIRNVSGSKGKPSTKTGKGAGKQIKRILAKEHSIDVIDFDYVNNVAFWNSMEDSAINYDLYYFTDTYGWVVTGTQISVEASDTITDDNTTFIEGSFIVTWAKKGNPLPYKADVDDLASCPELFSSGRTFSNLSGSLASIVGSNISIEDGDNISVHLQTGVTLGSVSLEDGDLPSGVTLGYSGPYITLSGTASGVGSYPVIIKGQNACGVGSDVTITITVTA